VGGQKQGASGGLRSACAKAILAMLQVSRICAVQGCWRSVLASFAGQRRYSSTTANLTAANKDIGKVTLSSPCLHPVFHSQLVDENLDVHAEIMITTTLDQDQLVAQTESLSRKAHLTCYDAVQ